MIQLLSKAVKALDKHLDQHLKVRKLPRQLKDLEYEMNRKDQLTRHHLEEQAKRITELSKRIASIEQPTTPLATQVFVNRIAEKQSFILSEFATFKEQLTASDPQKLAQLRQQLEFDLQQVKDQMLAVKKVTKEVALEIAKEFAPAQATATTDKG